MKKKKKSSKKKKTLEEINFFSNLIYCNTFFFLLYNTVVLWLWACNLNFISLFRLYFVVAVELSVSLNGI